MTIFLLPGGSQLPKLVAAQINGDCIDILVEQPLSLQAPADSSWADLTLEAAVNAILKAIDNQESADYTLTLVDPALRQEMKHIKSLGSLQETLLHENLRQSLRSLNPSDQQLLHQWLNRPSQTDVTSSEACAAVMEQLAQLQQHWSQFMPVQMANVAGVLELTIALANLSPSTAPI